MPLCYNEGEFFYSFGEWLGTVGRTRRRVPYRRLLAWEASGVASMLP